MSKTTKLLFLAVVVALLAFGCSNQGDQTGLPTGPVSLSLTPAIMAGDPVQSATLHMYVNRASGNTIEAHRITADWDESNVTWNNFGGAYDAAVEGTFMADGVGWRTVDVTALVDAWADGVHDNFGILLKYVDGVSFPRAEFNSREAADFHPMLEICYMTAGGPQCVQLTAIGDSFIMELDAYYQCGSCPNLGVGYPTETTLQKQTLVRFDMPDRPQPASIGDFVWLDANENGIQDAGEAGYPGATVRLYNCFGQLVASTTTDANGYYLFDNLTPGDYNIVFVLPEGYVFSPQDQGADNAMDSDADRQTGVAACTTLDPGEHDPTWDAGLFLPDWEGCSLTIGFWKTHCGFGPQADVVSQHLPIWLGAAGGSQSINVSNVQIAYNILVMKTYGDPSNGITKLYAQMLGAKLNIANGASDSAVASTIAAADAWLASHRWTEWSSLSKSMKTRILGWMTTFDNYNNGLIGPGHCK